MGSRAHGTWARLYADVWDHPKTAALARALEALGVDPDWSLDVAVGQLHRLACRLADTTDDGKLGHHAPRAFCRLIAWPHSRKVDAVHAAWMSSGFIDNPGTPEASLHGFDEMFGELVRKRNNKRAQRQRDGHRHVTGMSPPEPVTVTALSPHKIEIESKTTSLRSVDPPPPTGSGLTPDDLADIWGDRCPTMSQPDRPLAAGVRKQLAAALKREGKRDWYAAFARIGASPKLRGEEYDWQCPGILWAVGVKNLAALDAGQHDPKTNQVQSRTASLANRAQALFQRMNQNETETLQLGFTEGE